MWTNFTILALVTLQRLVELYIARRNTKRLLANGGRTTSGVGCASTAGGTAWKPRRRFW
jgi:isoprenylcysteine carboxyl methyltransferase (ICMT) family protein YpbQ